MKIELFGRVTTLNEVTRGTLIRWVGDQKDRIGMKVGDKKGDLLLELPGPDDEAPSIYGPADPSQLVCELIMPSSAHRLIICISCALTRSR